MNEVLITMDEAFQSIVTNDPEVLFLEVVSDYYQVPALQENRLSHPIPSFAQIKTEELESNLVWNLKSDEDLQKVLIKTGLRPDTPKHILLFDNIKLPCGRLESRFDASARLFSILYYFGFSRISIVLDSDVRSGFPDVFADQHPDFIQRFKSQFLASETQPSKAEPIDIEHWSPMHPDHILNYETMVQMLAGKLGTYRLLDARSAEEFSGVFTGYDYVPLAGKIPTADSVINGEYQVSSTENLPTLLARLATTLASKGINFEDRIVWYCGTGWQASRMCALTQALGFINVAIYDGGWNEWHQRNPEDGTEKPWGTK